MVDGLLVKFQLIAASADALFICHQIDGEMGGNSCIEAKAAVSRPSFGNMLCRLTLVRGRERWKRGLDLNVALCIQLCMNSEDDGMRLSRVARERDGTAPL